MRKQPVSVWQSCDLPQVRGQRSAFPQWVSWCVGGVDICLWCHQCFRRTCDNRCVRGHSLCSVFLSLVSDTSRDLCWHCPPSDGGVWTPPASQSLKLKSITESGQRIRKLWSIGHTVRVTEGGPWGPLNICWEREHVHGLGTDGGFVSEWVEGGVVVVLWTPPTLLEFPACYARPLLINGTLIQLGAGQCWRPPTTSLRKTANHFLWHRHT